MEDIAHKIMNNNNLFCYFLYYYLDDISTYSFQCELEEAKSQGISEKQFLAEHFASWIPCEEDCDQLMEKLVT